MAYATIAQLKAYLTLINSSEFTADATTDKVTLASLSLAQDLVTGTEVKVSNSGGALPAPLAADTVYYAIKVADCVFKLATSSANADAGTAIDLTTAGTGTHTVYKAIRDDDLLSDLLDRATVLITRECGDRSFVASTTTRYYFADALDLDGYTLLLDEDLLTVTELLNGDTAETEIPNTEYWLEDQNAGPPYYGIRLKVNSSYAWTWDTDGRIAVTGTWGWSASAPADIVQACVEWAAYLYQNKDAQVFDTIAFPETGIITVPKGIPAGVRRALGKYAKLI